MRDTTSEVTAGGGHQDPLERLQEERLGLAAARYARADALAMAKDPLMRGLGGQLLRAAGSIAANVVEGYSRGTTAERRERLERLTSIRRLLLTMIRTARESSARDRAKFQR